MKIRLTAALGLSAALLLSGCAANEATTPENTPAGGATDSAPAAEPLSGTLSGIGASSVGAAMTGWIAKFGGNQPNLTINYAPEGSSAGRGGLVDGAADFAGSDRAFKADENVAGAFAKCAPESKALDLPVYISPIAVIFKVDGVEELNLDAETLAAIFKGDITNWNDPKIAALNEGATLPDATITAVHRSDGSGTTENFTDYLNKVAPSVWDAEAASDWPYQGGEAAKGTSGVVQAVRDGVNTIGYADASQAEGLAIAKIGQDGNFEAPSAEAAAAVVEGSPREEGRDEHDLALTLDRTAEGYPLVLVAYALACADYQDDAVAERVKAFLGYIASEEGQQVAAETAGAAPLSEALRTDVLAAVDSIK